MAQTADVIFENCYSRVSLKVSGYYDAGGLGPTDTRGQCTASAVNCYWSGVSNAGGRSGTILPWQNVYNNDNQGISSNIFVQNCYYNKDLYTLSVANSGTGLTTAQMKTQSSYVGWDFENTWYMGEDGYPELKF